MACKWMESSTSFDVDFWIRIRDLNTYSKSGDVSTKEIRSLIPDTVAEMIRSEILAQDKLECKKKAK